jgi:hypothetical protein
VADEVAPATRSIYFYRARGLEAPPTRVDLRPLLAQVGARHGNDRYWIADREVHLCLVDGPRRARFAYSRRRALPQVEEDGNLNALGLRPNAGLAEAIHVIQFANGIVGSDFNFFGPRVSRFARFLTEVTGVAVVLEPLVRGDIAEQLARLADITLLRVKIGTAASGAIREVDASIAEMLRNAERTGATEVEIVLRASRGGREALDDRLSATVRRFLRVPAIRESAQILQVRGHLAGGGTSEIDLLHSHVVASEEIIREGPRTRALDTPAAYAAIERAHTALRQEIDGARAD